MFKLATGKPARSLSAIEKDTYARARDAVGRAPGRPPRSPRRRGSARTPRTARASTAYPDRDTTEYVFVDDTELRGPELDKHQKAVAAGSFTEIARRGRMSMLRRKQPGE